jgi:hypothetical protein
MRGDTDALFLGILARHIFRAIPLWLLLTQIITLPTLALLV